MLGGGGGCWDLGEYWCSEGGEGVALMRIVRAQVEGGSKDVGGGGCWIDEDREGTS